MRRTKAEKCALSRRNSWQPERIEPSSKILGSQKTANPLWETRGRSLPTVPLSQSRKGKAKARTTMLRKPPRRQRARARAKDLKKKLGKVQVVAKARKSKQSLAP